MFACTKSEFDIFARKPLQSAILGNFTTLYKSIALVDQSVLEFAIPGDNEHYIDLNVHLMVRGEFTKLDDTAVTLDISAVNNREKSLTFSFLAMSRVSTQYGQSILLTLQKGSEQQIRVYLPRRYVPVFTDDILAVDNGEKSLTFSFLGVTEKNAYNVVLGNK
jgi:hypothetical protein